MSWFESPIFSAVKGLASGLVGPLSTMISGMVTNGQNVDLEKFRNATGFDLTAYQVACAQELAMTDRKLAANSWWGPRLLYMIVGIPIACHLAAVFIDSTWKFGWGIPALPSDYRQFEINFFYSLFVISVVEKPISALSSLLHRK